ncbi:unnamed protein product [Macrosiphum euphorbiae]|uniref:Uncharacterized protein n=2 Tax=Macrosiphum euphorbiae TaxID=13131 RepID=A0AAV0XEC0_9HEMI|nr:unnamed protein product [Macrosiphum euphorbiae]
MYCVLAFLFTVISTIRCVPLVNLTHSDNLKNSPTILETLNTIDILNTMNFMCRKNETKKGTDELKYYCRDLIKENGTYLPLEYIIETKITKIRSSLVKFFNLENKAIVCRGMRHLLPIIMHGISINNTVNGSTGNGNSGINTFEELFKKKPDFLNDENSSIEKKFQQIKALTMKNGKTNKKLDESPEQSNGKFSVTSNSIVENIITTVRLILPFIENLDCFHNLYKIDKIPTANKSDRNSLLLLIFDEVKIMYRTECYADVDVAALLQNRDAGWKFERKYDSIPLLVREIDRLSAAIQKDLVSLFVKFLPAYDPKRPLQLCPDVSIVFYHTFNKYHDPEVWRLIGNEAIVDHSSDSGKAAATSIDQVASNLTRNIQFTTDRLTALITEKVKCRCYTYLNLFMKLYYCSVRVLVENVREVRQSAQALEPIDQHKVYSLLHDKIKGLWTAECSIGDDVGAIDELLDREGSDKYFQSAYAAYWNRNARSVGKAIETVSNYSSDLGFVEGFGPLLQEIRRIRVRPEIEKKSIEYLVNRYKWGERAYKDQCFPGEYDDNVFTFSSNMKRALQVTTADNITMRLTLGWIMAMTDTLNDDLEADLDIINNKFP